MIAIETLLMTNTGTEFSYTLPEIRYELVLALIKHGTADTNIIDGLNSLATFKQIKRTGTK